MLSLVLLWPVIVLMLMLIALEHEHQEDDGRVLILSFDLELYWGDVGQEKTSIHIVSVVAHKSYKCPEPVICNPLLC